MNPADENTAETPRAGRWAIDSRLNSIPPRPNPTQLAG